MFIRKKVATLVALVGLIASCAPPTPKVVTKEVTKKVEVTKIVTKEVPAKRIEVDFWTTEVEEERMVAQRAMAAEFMAEHPDILVKVVPVLEDEVPEKIAAAKAAKALPDCARFGLEYVSGYAMEGILDEAANTAVIEELGEDTFYTGALEMVKSPTGKAKYAAVPFDGWVQGVWYRKDLFEGKGLSPPDSFDNILAAAKAFHDPAKPMFGLVFGTHPEKVYTQQTFEHFALANGARAFDAEGNITMNTDRMVEAIDFYAKLAKYTPPGHCYWREARSYYIIGQTPMMFYSPYILDDIAGLVEKYEVTVPDLAKKTAFAPIIEGFHGDKASYGQLVAHSIFTGADTDAAKEWLKYLLTKAYVDWLFMTPGGKTPVRKGFAETWGAHPWFEYYEPGMPELLMGGLEKVSRWGFQAGKCFPLISDIYGAKLIPAAIGEVIEGTKTPEEAAAWLQEQVEALK